eukprot:1347502-Prymnesium_polylepis.1
MRCTPIEPCARAHPPWQLRSDMGELEQRLGGKGGGKALLPGIVIPGIASPNEAVGSPRFGRPVAPRPTAKSPGGSPKTRRPTLPFLEAGVRQPMPAPTEDAPRACASAPSPSEESAWVV